MKVKNTLPDDWGTESVDDYGMDYDLYQLRNQINWIMNRPEYEQLDVQFRARLLNLKAHMTLFNIGE